MILIILLILFVIGIYGGIHSSHDNWSKSNLDSLSPFAEVVSVDTRRYDNYHFQTEVRFDDGFVYRSYDTKRESSFLEGRRIVITPEMKKEIVRKAIQQHLVLINQRGASSESSKRSLQSPLTGKTLDKNMKLLTIINDAAVKKYGKPTISALCTRGPIKGQVASGEVLYIGKDPDLCQLVFPNDTPDVGKVHCMLHTDEEKIELRDMNTSGGTYLSNGTKLKPDETVELLNGSSFFLGNGAIKIDVVADVKEYRFICTSCNAKSSGWYQQCPNCGSKGTMKRI